jgi:hypothetical protein
MKAVRLVLGFYTVCVLASAANPCQLSPDGKRLICPEGNYTLQADGKYHPVENTVSQPSMVGHVRANPSTQSPSAGAGAPRPIVPISSAATSPRSPAFNGPSTRGTRNPGWAFDMLSNARRKLTSCAATLFSVENNVCRALSAAHCFEKVLASAAREVAKNGCSPDNAITAVGDVLSASFKMNSEATGVINARVHINDRYYDKNTGDMAVIEWACPSPPALKVVPLCTTGPGEGESVQYGKIMGQKGLYPAKVRLMENFIDSSGLRSSRRAVSGTLEVQQSGPRTEFGDSGGPLIKTSEQCLLAALSGRTDYDSGPVAIYGTSEIGDQPSTSAYQFANKTNNSSTRSLASVR